MLDLRRLRLHRELPRRGTIAAVAEALSYSPSAVSQQLATLEKEVRVRLLEPSGRRVRLTPAAELLVAHAGVLLEEMERTEAALAVPERDRRDLARSRLPDRGPGPGPARAQRA